MEGSKLRIVSFNVNGLRACLKRKFGTLKRLLEELGADIICFQETKIPAGTLDRELAVVEGWDSFFSCAQTARGYSGVATFCRTALALPFASEEGFTGCRAAQGGVLHPSLAERYTVEELQELDSEGRVVITDHGAFVLFNIYGPALSSEENFEQRLEFKLKFYQALQRRWEEYLQRGRAVVVIGDLNICPAPIDSCDPDPDFYSSSRPARLWLRALLRQPSPAQPAHPPNGRSGSSSSFQPGQEPSQSRYPSTQPGPRTGQVPSLAALEGPPPNAATGVAPPLGVASSRCSSAEGQFVDAFRVFHPHRSEAYTCWNTATAARANNYGARIDLALVAGLPCAAPPSLVAAAGGNCAGRSMAQGRQFGQEGLQPGAAGSSGSGGCGGAGASLAAAGQQGCAAWVSGSDIMPDTEGSDHCPVWVELSCAGRFPCASAAPPCASRHLFTGKQLKLRQYFGAAQQAQQAQQQQAQQQPSEQEQAMGSVLASHPAFKAGVLCEGSAPPEESDANGAPVSTAAPRDCLQSSGPASSQPPQQRQFPLAAGPVAAGAAAAGAAAGAAAAGSKRGGVAGSWVPPGKKQASLKSFFSRQAGAQQQAQQAQTQQAQAQQAEQAQQPALKPALLRQEGLPDAAPSALESTGSGSAPGMGPPAAAATAGTSQESGSGGGSSMAAGAGAGSAAGWEGAAEGAAGPSQAGPSQAGPSQGGPSQGGANDGPLSAADAASAWRRIQQRMAVPQCRHGEPAALKRVGKSGPNHGRYFYVCRRPDGKPPEGQCNFFQWVKPTKEEATKQPSKPSGSGGGSRPSGSKRR